jgi:hypothetical protein
VYGRRPDSGPFSDGVCLASLLVAGLDGCATYHPEPLDAAKTARQFDSRSLSNGTVANASAQTWVRSFLLVSSKRISDRRVPVFALRVSRGIGGSPPIEWPAETSAWSLKQAIALDPETFERTQVTGVSFVVFDRKQLAKDIMATISQLTDGKEFLGHDGRKYWIVSRDGKPESKGLMDVVVRGNGADTTVASYGVVLIRISPQ